MEQIRVARKEQGWTQEKLADAIGVKRSVISKYESGAISPSIDTIQRIATALGTDIPYLLSGDSAVVKSNFAGGIHVYKSASPHKVMKAFLSDFTLDSCEFYYHDEYLLIAVENGSNVSDEELKQIVSAYAPYKKQQDYIQGKGDMYRIESAFNQMNDEGQRKVADYAEDILPRYRRQDIPTEQDASERPQEPPKED